MILSNDIMTLKQIGQVNQLAEACEVLDGGLPVIYHNLMQDQRSKDSNILFYDQGQLCGFLGIYYFYYDACEVTLFVHPQYRKQNVAKQLLCYAMPIWLERGMIRILFSGPERIGTDSWLRERGLTYFHTEYTMQRTSLTPLVIPDVKLITRAAQLDDIKNLEYIDSQCFPNIYNKVPTNYHSVLTDPCFTVLLSCLNDVVIGKAHIRWNANEAFLSDIGVLPAYQHNGYGAEIVGYCINYVLARKPLIISLDVISKNGTALAVYTKYDFKVISAHDYWQIKIEPLKAFLGIF